MQCSGDESVWSREVNPLIINCFNRSSQTNHQLFYSLNHFPCCVQPLNATHLFFRIFYIKFSTFIASLKSISITPTPLGVRVFLLNAPLRFPLSGNGYIPIAHEVEGSLKYFLSFHWLLVQKECPYHVLS